MNDSLCDAPENLSEDPENNGWLFKIKTSGAVDTEGMMDEEAYRTFCEEEAEDWGALGKL